MAKRRKNKASFDKCLPVELWTEILARLPTKVLVKFRCVCKSWCSIVDNTKFPFMHATLFVNNVSKTHLLTIERRKYKGINGDVLKILDTSTFRTFGRPMNLGRGCIVRDYVSGVLLLDRLEFEFRLELWNPSLRKSLDILQCDSMRDLCRDSFCFGFAPSRNDCKVIGVRSPWSQHFSKLPCYIAIYSESTSIWKCKVMDVEDCWCIKGKPLYAKGALHWLARDGRLDHHERATHMASFDLDSEVFSFVSLPDAVDDCGRGNPLRYTFLHGGLVALFSVYPLYSCIWVMDMESGAEDPWTKCFSIDLPYGIHEFFSHYGDCIHHFLYIERPSKLVMLIEGEIKSYDLESHRIEDVGTSNRACISYIDLYVESLVFHKGSMLNDNA